YAARDRALWRTAKHDSGAVSLRGTGSSIIRFLFPLNKYPQSARYFDRSELWASTSGRPRNVLNSKGSPIILFNEGVTNMAVSPNGSNLVTVLPFEFLPTNWKTKFRAASGFSGNPVFGHQNLLSQSGWDLIGRYVVINLSTGKITELTTAPTGRFFGWVEASQPLWRDDRTILLPNTFVAATPGPACIAVVTPGSKATCVAGSSRFDEQYTAHPNFVAGRPNEVSIDYVRRFGAGAGQEEGRSDVYETTDRPTSTWRLVRTANRVLEKGAELRFEIAQTISTPPVFEATDILTGSTRSVFDPNPQIAELELAHVSQFVWTNSVGREFKGILYRPQVKQKHPIPLVIQTHGFLAGEFRPSGIFPIGFAAQAMAMKGIAVLQVSENCPSLTRDEAACAADGYFSAVEKLAGEGLIDRNRVGLSGFSRTVYYVLSALVSKRLHFAAALITDGVDAGYFQYLAEVDDGQSEVPREYDKLNAARPFGAGLKAWLVNSPEFNSDKIT